MFAGLSGRLLGLLATRLFEKTYAAGEVIFRQGDPGRGLFIVVEGEVQVVRSNSGREEHLATFGSGTTFGELALIDELPRTATARAVAPSRVLILYRAYFDALVEGNRAVAIAVMRNLLSILAGYVRAAGANTASLDVAGNSGSELASAPSPRDNGPKEPSTET